MHSLSEASHRKRATDALSLASWGENEVESTSGFSSLTELEADPVDSIFSPRPLLQSLLAKPPPSLHINAPPTLVGEGGVARKSTGKSGMSMDIAPSEKSTIGRCCLRSLLGGLVVSSLLTAAPLVSGAASMPGTAPGCTSTSNPSGYTLVTCDRQGLDRNGRLLGCRCVPIASCFLG